MSKMSARAEAFRNLLLQKEKERGHPISIHVYDACYLLSKSTDPDIRSLFIVTPEQMTPWETFGRDLRQSLIDDFGKNDQVYWLKGKSNEQPELFGIVDGRKAYIKYGTDLRDSKRFNQPPPEPQEIAKSEPIREPSPSSVDNPKNVISFTGKQIVEHVYTYLRAEGLNFSLEQVADFYLAVRTKPFVLLAGISGTGKSVLARRFAEACGFSAALIPVRPDWGDSSELIGYRDLQGAFVPGRLIQELVLAILEPEKPRFVILDEMNLARVEHYLSDYLSLIETRKHQGDHIVTDPLSPNLGQKEDFRCSPELSGQLRTVLQNGPLNFPSNLCLIGTVNMDESTHPFSKKVLDRAMTLEFVDVDLQVIPEPKRPPDPLLISATDLSAPYLSLAEIYRKNHAVFDSAIQLLVELNKVLKSASLQVGYRTRDEICIYLHHNIEQGELLSASTAMDLAIYHKILPRLQGGEEIRDLLTSIKQILSAHKLTHCLQKLGEMQERLERAGFTAFWS